MNLTITAADDLVEAREVAAAAFDAAAGALPKEADLSVDLVRTDDDFVTDEMGGVVGWARSAERIQIEVDPAADGWREMLRATAAHEYAHAWFYDRLGRDELRVQWEYLLFEAHAQHFAARRYPSIRTPWREHVDRETLGELWPRIREEQLDADLEGENPLFFGGDGYPGWTGYSLSYAIGEELLASHELEAFPTLGRADVAAAGDALFGPG